MCRAMEEMVCEAKKEEKLEVAEKLLQKGKLTLEEIAECCKLTLEEVKKLQEEIYEDCSVEVSADTFYSKGNINHLEKIISNIEAGRATLVEHDLIEK